MDSNENKFDACRCRMGGRDTMLCRTVVQASWILCSILLGGVIIAPTTLHAEQVGKFTVVRGAVDSLRELNDAPLPAQVGMGTFMQDVVRTKHRSRTQLKFIDETLINMGPDYMMEINEYLFDADKKVRSGVIQVLRGKMRATVAKVGDGTDSQFEVHTPTAVAAARGTEFIVDVISSLETMIVVLEGIVSVRNADPLVKGEVLVKAGQMIRVTRGKPPMLATFAAPEYLQLLIRQTTPDVVMPPSTGLELVEVAPIPPPPTIQLLPATRPNPIVLGVNPVGNGQPPATETMPALLYSPVTLVVGFP